MNKFKREEIHLEEGDIVTITDTDGFTIRGRVDLCNDHRGGSRYLMFAGNPVYNLDDPDDDIVYSDLVRPITIESVLVKHGVDLTDEEIAKALDFALKRMGEKR